MMVITGWYPLPTQVRRITAVVAGPEVQTEGSRRLQYEQLITYNVHAVASEGFLGWGGGEDLFKTTL